MAVPSVLPTLLPCLLFSVQCTNVCPSSFAIEEDYGRARVMRQGVDTEDKLQEAIDTCPVSCIHWVSCRITLVCITFSKHSRASSQSSQNISGPAQTQILSMWNSLPADIAWYVTICQRA